MKTPLFAPLLLLGWPLVSAPACERTEDSPATLSAQNSGGAQHVPAPAQKKTSLPAPAAPKATPATRAQPAQPKALFM